MLIAASAVLAAGCDLSTGEITGVNQFVRVHNPTGSVTGLVTDSNNRPLQNATVTLGTKTTRTNAGGQYQFNGVRVANVVTSDGELCSSECLNSFKITVTPPAVTAQQTNNYMGAIVSVLPFAQFHDASPQFTDENQALEAAGAQTIFVDGFNIQAGTAVLPELTATVEVDAIRNPAGQPVVGVTASLDFIGIDSTDDSEEAGGECDEGCSVRYPTVSWTATTGADGGVSFTNLPANSVLALQLDRHICEEGANNPDEDDNDNDHGADTCEIITRNEEGVTFYENFTATPLGDVGDDENPSITTVTGVYDFDDGNDTECPAKGLLLRSVVGTGSGFRINFSEALSGTGVTSSSVAVWNATEEEYVAVASVTVSGSTVIVTTSAAVPAGDEIDIYLFRPDFLDLAGNAIVENDVDEFDGDTFDCEDVANNFTGYLAVSLSAFEQPSVNVDAVAWLQELDDPRFSGFVSEVDRPISQFLAPLAFADVIDDSIGVYDDLVAQMNATDGNQTPNIEEALHRRAHAYAEDDNCPTCEDDIWADVVRIEFEPVAGANSYIVTRTNRDSDQITMDDSDFSDDQPQFTNTLGGSQVLSGFSQRDGGFQYLLVISESEEGDEICIAATDDLDNPGDSFCATIEDNVAPTVTVQRSYQNLHDFFDSEISGTSVQGDPTGDNLSGCWLNTNDISDDEYHAGVNLLGASSSIGDGGELVLGGTDDAFGPICIGFSPELFIPNDGATDAAAAHATLADDDRDADFDAVQENVDDFNLAYDAAAFAAWARAPVKMGAAFTEDLGPGVGTVTTDLTGLSNYDVLNNTVNGHLQNWSGDSPLVMDMVTFDVADAYVVSRDDHAGSLDFGTAVTDLAGNASDGAELQARDMWPLYIVSGQRNTDGTITLEFDTPPLFDEDDNDDTITFIDGDGDTATFTFSFTGGQPDGWTQAGTTVTIDTTYLPSIGIAGAFDDADLVYDDADTGTGSDHTIVMFGDLHDEHGNGWDNHEIFRDQTCGDEVSDCFPVFILPDDLDAFAVSATSSGATNGSLTFTFTLTGTHAISNFFDETQVAVNNPDPMTTQFFTGEPGGDCTEAVTGAITCDENFVITYLDAGTCVVDTTSTATFNATRTQLVFDVDCDTTGLTTADTIGLMNTANTVAESDFDGTLESAADTVTVP